MAAQRSQSNEDFYRALQSYARIYTFRDPGNACLFGLRVNECYVLDLLVEDGPMSTSQLAKRLGIHKSNASRIASALEKRGLFRLQADPDDRRALVISPTPDGVTLRNEVKAYFVDRLKTVTGSFTLAEMDSFMRILSALTSEAEARIAKP